MYIPFPLDHSPWALPWSEATSRILAMLLPADSNVNFFQVHIFLEI